MYWLSLFSAIICNIIANISFKKAISRAPPGKGIDSLLELLNDPWMWTGGVSCVLLLFFYVYSLKGLDLSIAYPVTTGLAMLGIVVSGALFFGETISATRIVAIIFIFIGVLLLKISY